jgi:hypothetical protein
MNIADQRNFAAGLVYFVLGVAVAIAANRYRMGSLARMGPGYFPFAAGMALGIVGVWLMGQAARRGAPLSTMGAWSGRSLIVVLSSVLLFGLLIDSMGLPIAVTALVGLASRAHPRFSWRVLTISLAVLLLVTWTVFVRLLGLPFSMLPRL